jgi:hypothetical protein
MTFLTTEFVVGKKTYYPVRAIVPPVKSTEAIPTRTIWVAEMFLTSSSVKACLSSVDVRNRTGRQRCASLAGVIP